MQDLINTNRELIDIFKENIRDPFLLLDRKGNILSFNNQASIFFSFHGQPGNFYNLIDQPSSKKISELFNNLPEINIKVEEILELGLNNGGRLNVQLTANKFIKNNEILILVLIKLLDDKTSVNKTSLKIKIKEIDKLINNKEVLNVIEEIKSNFPFTFISKNKTRKSVDKLKEYFWIKNEGGNYILVNDKVSDSLGLNVNQIEGRKESNFIPPYLVNFQQSINQYIIESANCIILDGLRFGSMNSLDEFETIEIPLLDSENKIIAIIGIGQQKLEKKEILEIDPSLKNMLDHISCPVAFIDEKNIIKYFNNEFSRLYGNKFIDFTKTEYFKLLPLNISEKISGFIKSSLDEELLEIEEEGKSVLIKFRKVYSENLYCGTSMSFEEKTPEIEKVDESNLQINDKLLKDNPFPVFIFNKENLKFLAVNDAALKLYDYTKEEFLNLDMTDLYTEEDMQTLLELTTENIKEGVFNGPYNHKKKDGSKILIELCKISISYKGKEAGLNVVRDVTKKVELEKKNKLYKAVFDNTDTLLFITDPSGFVTYINSQVTSILDYSEQELKNTSFAALFNDDKRAFINNEIFKNQSHNTVSLTADIKNSKGEFYTFEVNAVPIINYKNEIDSFVIIAKYKKQEIVIETKASEAKSDRQVHEESLMNDPTILSGMFHEILTPINVILGFVQDLTESIEVLTPEQKEASDIINQNRINLLNTMNTIIDFVNLSDININLNIDEIKITDIIDSVQKDITNIINKKDFQLSYGKISSSLVFKSDSQKLQNLIYLLFILTAQTSREDKIYLSAYQYDDENFIIIIKDNYSFTSEGLINKLKVIISNGASKNKNLGISKFTILLIRKLLRLLNGSVKIIKENDKKEFGLIFPMDLKVQSKITEDTKIEIEKEEHVDERWLDENLPVEKDINGNMRERFHENYDPESIKELEESDILVEEAPQNISAKKINLSELKCLYVEDQIDSQILFNFQMSELKEIQFAASLEEAIPILETKNFDFIILDINLQGDYNGIDALKFIHRIPGFENTPIIAATAYLLPGDKEKFISAGFNDFISKPIFHDNMVESLKKLF